MLRSPGRTRTVALAASLLASAAVGCSSHPSPAAPVTSAQPHSSPSTGASTAPPTATPLPDPAFDDGQVVIVTPDGVRPHWLVSIVNRAIVWRNMTDTAVRVVFDHQPISSRPIPPGAAFRYRPDHVFSFTYRVEGLPHAGGAVQVSEPLGG